MLRSGWAREPWPLSLRIQSLCSTMGEATTVRGPRTAKKIKNKKSPFKPGLGEGVPPQAGKGDHRPHPVAFEGHTSPVLPAGLTLNVVQILAWALRREVMVEVRMCLWS